MRRPAPMRVTCLLSSCECATECHPPIPSLAARGHGSIATIEGIAVSVLDRGADPGQPGSTQMRVSHGH